MTKTTPLSYPFSIRLILALLAFVFIGLTFKVMSALTQPSLYVNAIETIKAGPKKAGDIQNPSFLNFKNYLYVVGPVVSASQESNTQPLFSLHDAPALVPSTFTDSTGAVEVLSHKLPLTANPPDQYRFNQSLHLLGWRTKGAGFSLFAVAETKQALLGLLENHAKGWKTTLFVQGLFLALLVFTIFWLMNLSLLSTPYLQNVQLWIVNVVFLLLFYSVLALSGYPLFGTILQTLEILAISNIIFVPLSILISRKRAV